MTKSENSNVLAPERNAATPSVVSPVSDLGLRVRLFLAKDVPDIVSKAGKPLVKGVRPGEIAERLNLAFFAAYVAAEHERADLAPADLEGACRTVATRARQLLRALRLPTEPSSYGRDGIFWRHAMLGEPFKSSPIASRLRRAILDLESLPSVLDIEETKRTSRTTAKERLRRALLAVEKAPLTDRTIPTSIAERTLPIVVYTEIVHTAARNLSESSTTGLADAEARLAVGLLLDMAPSAIALLISLAGLVGKQAAAARVRQAAQGRRDKKRAGPRKPNYGRTFTATLFYWLATVYWHSFQQEPDTHVDDGEPGPATVWVDKIFDLASRRFDRIRAVRVPQRGPIRGRPLADESERQRLLAVIRAAASLEKSTKAKRLRQEWRKFWDGNAELARPI